MEVVLIMRMDDLIDFSVFDNDIFGSSRSNIPFDSLIQFVIKRIQMKAHIWVSTIFRIDPYEADSLAVVCQAQEHFRAFAFLAELCVVVDPPYELPWFDTL